MLGLFFAWLTPYGFAGHIADEFLRAPSMAAAVA
jgi:hypothetical protein